MKTHPSHSRRKGFTILELMVAMTITAIIVGVLVTITGTAIDTWNNSRNELRAARQAEAMINIMTKDLESLVVRSDRPQEWLSAIQDDDALNPSGAGDASASNAIRMIFFTAATDRYNGQVGITGQDLGGDISCVGYRLAWKDPISSNDDDFPTFVLSRHLVDPNLTFQTLLGQTNGDTLDNVFDAAYGTRFDEDRNFVCENIYQFTTVFHIDIQDPVTGLETRMVSVSSNSNGKQVIQVKHNAIEARDSISDANGDPDLLNGVLTAVEVSVTVLTDTAISQLRSNANLPNTPNFDDWLAKNSYSFSRLIQVPRK